MDNNHQTTSAGNIIQPEWIENYPLIQYYSCHSKVSLQINQEN